MERHAYSSQAFMPFRASRYIAAAAPANASGGPDLSRLQAFVARGSQAVNYRTGVWHCPLLVLDKAAQFVVLMWKDGSGPDEEFIQLPEPLQFVD
jgi:ureidoglycolate lyase